ncbi:MAG: CoA transferase subunit A, partial [Gammaproteobacteria bacterium]
MTDLLELSELAARIVSGSTLALPPDYAGPPMAATRALLERETGDLSLVSVPQTGMQADLLIGAGRVRAVESAAVTLGEFGTAPCFARGVKAGAFELRDSTCPAIHAGLQASEKGLPFMVLRGIIGSDLLAHRADWRVLQNPFAVDNAGTGGAPADDPIVALPAIRPDVALIHAPLA